MPNFCCPSWITTTAAFPFLMACKNERVLASDTAIAVASCTLGARFCCRIFTSAGRWIIEPAAGMIGSSPLKPRPKIAAHA
jgi:hypothetical protein